MNAVDDAVSSVAEFGNVSLNLVKADARSVRRWNGGTSY
jgi:hypothetical protein